MHTHLQKLSSLRLEYREGGDLREIIDGVMVIAKLVPNHTTTFSNTLLDLKDKIDALALRFRNKTVDISTYTLEWDQIVRDTMQVIDRLEQILSGSQQ